MCNNHECFINHIHPSLDSSGILGCCNHLPINTGHCSGSVHFLGRHHPETFKTLQEIYQPLSTSTISTDFYYLLSTSLLDPIITTDSSVNHIINISHHPTRPTVYFTQLHQQTIQVCLLCYYWLLLATYLKVS